MRPRKLGQWWLVLFLMTTFSWTAGALPNLFGFDGRSYSQPSYYFRVSSSSVGAGQPVTVYFYVANLGDAASGTFNIRFYLSKDSTIDPATDYTLYTWSSFPSLNAGTFNGGSVTVQLPAEDTINALGGAGTFYIGMYVDYSGAVSESNENDNRNLADGADRASLAVTIPGPDLVGFDGRPTYANAYFDVQDGALTWGDPCSFRLAVWNASGGNATNFKAKVYVCTNSTIDSATGYLVYTLTFSGGMKGLTYSWYTNQLSLPAVNPFGNNQTNFYIGMVVDADGEVTETNEVNNRNQGNGIDRDSAIIVNPTPDVFATDSASPNNDYIVAFSNVAHDGVGNAKGVQTVTLLNKGKAALIVSNLVLSGSTNFALTEIASSIQNFISPASFPRTIAVKGSESWVLTIEFDPTSSGVQTGLLTVVSSDPDTPNLAVSLTGVGQPVPDIAVTTPEAAETDFGEVVQDGAGGYSAIRTVSLKNIGTGPLTVNGNGISLLSGTAFTMLSITSSTRGAISLAATSNTIAGEGTEVWDVLVRFDPTVNGQTNDGLRVLSDDPDEAMFVASLRGRGVGAMQLSVTDSSGSPTDRSIVFPATHADGTGNELSTATVTLQNVGEAALTVASNGVAFATGTHFRVQGITSDVQGNVNLSAGAAQIAGSTSETWTVTVAFDPLAGGAVGDTLRIVSDNLAAPTVTVAVAGSGAVRPALSVTDSSGPSNDLAVAFGAVLNDGAGKRSAVQTVRLKNVGTQPLIVSQNGLPLSGGAGFSVTGVVSSTRGSVSIASANNSDRTIAPTQTEVWTVSVAFDPAANGGATGTLQILSNDPSNATVAVGLAGTGAVPVIALTAPATNLNVSAGSVFEVAWTDAYAAGDARIALYADTDTNPASGLIAMATNLSEDDAENAYAWRVSEALTGGTYAVYAAISDGAVTNGSYAPGRLTVDALGSFKLRSPVEVTSPDYAYEYEYNGQIYQGVTHLQLGDNVVTVSNPSGNGTATFQFTVRLVPSLVPAETVEHDELDRIETIKNGNGIETRMIYDAMSRLVRRESDNGAVVQFGYDVLGRRTNMVDATGTTFYEWDDLDRLTAAIRSRNSTKGDADDLALRYEYDLAGRETAMAYPGGERVEYAYDAAGRMLAASNVTRGLGFAYTYNSTNGLLTKLARPNGIETLYSYDGMGRLTNLLHQVSGGALVANYAYALDAAGRATEFRVTETGGVQRIEQYTYDRFDRLAKAVYSGDGVVDTNDPTVTYAYDGNGNRLAMTTRVNGAVTQVRLYQYGNGNRLLRVTDGAGAALAEYAYDAAGNVLQETTTNRTRFFSYDERNLLVGVVDGANHIVYAYDGDGRQVSRTANGQTAGYVVDGNRDVFETVEERDAAGAVSATYTFGDTRLASVDGGVATFELADRLGSARRITTAAGATSVSYAYDVFGAATVLAGSPARFAFGGERVDPDTGLVFLRARYYAPEFGRFFSKDPMGVSAGLNGHVYCSGDPVNATDPLGLAERDPSQENILQDPSGVILNNVGDALGLNWCGANLGGGDWNYGRNDQGLLPLGNLDVQPKTFDSPILDAIELVSPLGGAIIRGINALDSASKIHDYEYYNDVMAGLGHGGADLRVVGNVLGSMLSPSIEASVIAQAQGMNSANTPVIAGQISVDTIVQDASGNRTYYPTADGPGLSFSELLSTVRPGGVLIDKAAQWVGSNLSDIRGAVYDPVTGQFVFLGTEGAAGVKDINLDCLYTALQAVYGSAVPPFVTLDPPMTAYNQWTDYGDGDGAFEPGERGGFLLRYKVRWSGEDHAVKLVFRISGTRYTAVMDALTASNIYIGGERAMYLRFNRWETNPPTGVAWASPTNGGISLNGIYFGSGTFSGTDGQDTYYPIALTNSGSQNYVVDQLSVMPDRQHRKFGGRVENTRLGWVMLEADRVMKCLAVGRDNLLTNIAYNSGTVAVSGYSNMTQRGGTGNIRMWFTPNEMTLKRHLDAETGRASIVFDKASVALNTESFMMGLPQPAEARAFADHFTSNYDAFAAISFPCVDPNDATGTNIVQVKIFEQLREAMQAVSLARFFRDNNVPVDMWWLNSWTPPVAYSPKSTPTAYNEENGMIIYGGVQVNKPNTYVPSATAKSVADVVQASRPDLAGNPGGDIKQPVWTNNTSEGTLKAVAAQTDAEQQDGNLALAELDLSFASPGALPLQFERWYQSSWLGGMKMGPGWRITPFVLEFERPSWFDENSLMRNGTNAVWKDSSKNTRLRSGALRVVDLRSGAVLDFTSSLVLGYAIDNIGNAVITVTGLGSTGVPTFSPGLRQSGATLAQATNTYGYVFDTPDGGEISFDHEGRLLQTRDRYLKTQTYTYDALGNLTNIADAAGQRLVIAYDSATTRVLSVSGPAGETVSYGYSATGCLVTATHARSGATTTYDYNANRQLVKKTMFNGLSPVVSAPDLKGRAEEEADARSNTVVSTFTQDADGEVRVTETSDPQITDPSFEPWRKEFDREGRLLSTRDATGAETAYGYASGSLLPTTVDLPVAGRPAISIERNAYGMPTRISDPGNVGAQDVTATYDPVTKLLQQSSDEAGRNTELAYNTNRSLARIRRHLGAQNVDVTYSYTTNGAMLTTTNALGVRALTVHRDALDRATNVIDATGVSIRYQYDTLGRLWKMMDPRLSNAVEYVYDNFDRVIEIRYPAGSVFYEYDAAKGWLVRQTDILGRSTHYVRDPINGDVLQIVDEVSNGTDRVTTLAYNRFGQITNIAPPDVQAMSFSYDDLGRALGSAECDAAAPAAPRSLDSTAADDAVWTNSASQPFTWGAPSSDSGIDGYSVAVDGSPDQGVDTSNALSNVAGLTEGQHTFQVRARTKKGTWGPPAVFNLWIDRTVPSAAAATVGVARSGCGNYVVGTSVDATWSGFSDALSGVDRYYFSFSNNGGTANGNTSASTAGTLAGPALDATNRVYVWARDRAGNIGLAATTSVLVLNPDGDRDGDGMKNSAEEVAGTGADDKNELLWLSPELRLANGKIEVSWFAVSNRVYDLLFTTNFSRDASNSWLGVVSCTNRTGGEASMTYTGAVPTVGQQLYRVRVRRP